MTNEQVLVELNTDFSTKGLSAQEIQSIVAAWQANAINPDTMTALFPAVRDFYLRDAVPTKRQI